MTGVTEFDHDLNRLLFLVRYWAYVDAEHCLTEADVRANNFDLQWAEQFIARLGELK